MLKMRVKLIEHCLGNVLDRRVWVVKTWIMAWPDDMRCWVGWPHRTLHPFEIAEQLFQVRNMIMNALIVVLPAVRIPLCLESQDKRINILLGKGLKRLGVRMLLDEKSEKVSQTIGTSMQRARADTSRQFALDKLLDDRTKDDWYILKINVVVGGMRRIAESWDQSGIPFLFCELLCELFQWSECCCSLNGSDVRVFHRDFAPLALELGQTCSCVCSQAARNASFAGWTY